MEDLNSWLSQPPKYTTFRVNLLKQFNIKILEKYLVDQALKIGCPKLPNFYLLKPDCLILEQWPNELPAEEITNEIIVDSLCAAAVLRGAHVFAPGVLGLPTILLQNLPSIVCGWVLDVRPNEVVLDMCASPGNKTTHLAEMSKDEAIIIAIDKTQQKVAKIQENCIRQGVKCVKAYAFDSTKCCSIDSKGTDLGPPFPPNSFDKVLLDGPCSGLGQRPQLNNKMSAKMLDSYKLVQRKLVKAAVEVLKVGGKLVYSTCTVTVDENEGIVQWLLENFPNMKLVTAEPLLGGPGLAGCGLSDEQRIMVQRFSPHVDPLRATDEIYRDTIGFFIAKFIKT